MMNLAVVPELRRRGTAQALLQALQEGWLRAASAL